MPFITLISDWTKEDYYVGAVKGAIYSQLPDAKIVDLSHQVDRHNTTQAAFILKSCYQRFPAGTVHIIGIRSQHAKGDYLVAKKDNQFFLAADNGIFGLLFKEKPEEIIRLQLEKGNSPFPELDIFASAACRISEGEDLSTLGEKLDDYYKNVPYRAIIEDDTIIGKVLYIDSYENAITNISRQIFERVGKGLPFRINMQYSQSQIRKLNTSYDETTPGEILALFNSLDLLEIAQNGGEASNMLNLNKDSTVRVNFERKKKI